MAMVSESHVPAPRRQRRPGKPGQILMLIILIGACIAAGIQLGWPAQLPVLSFYQRNVARIVTLPIDVVNNAWMLLFACVGFSLWLAWRSAGPAAISAIMLIAAHFALAVIWFSYFKTISGMFGGMIGFTMMFLMVLTLWRVGKHQTVSIVFMLPYAVALMIIMGIETREYFVTLARDWKGIDFMHCGKSRCD